MRQQHQLQQGSAAWHQFRSEHFGASEAAAMLGISPYTTRAELLKQKATGEEKEVSPQLQAVFDRGHETEIGGRALAEAIIEDDLFPVVMSFGDQSASCDGLTMCSNIAFEHKQWSASLAESIANGVLPEHHQPQCQQVMHVTGATRCLFMTSDGTDSKCQWMWVERDQVWIDRIIAGWKQFAADLAAYQHVEVIPAVVAAPINDLPALAIEITGNVVASNLSQWRGIVTERIASINTDLQTDQQFADADKMVKFLADGEQRIEVVKAQAQSQATSIDEVFRALDEIRATMRTKRLELDKLVKARKENIRGEIAQEGMKAYAEHCAALNARLKGQYLPGSITAAFAEVMKGKKTVASLRDAVSTELARVKIESNALADKIDANLKRYGELAVGFEFLFRDLMQLVMQPAEAFDAMVQQRISQHQEQKRREEEATRERIAKEEREKAEREAAATLEAERKADREAAEKAKQQQTDQATVSSNGASSTPGFPQLSPAEAVAPEPAPSAAPTATGAASVAPISPVAGEIERAGLVSELRESLLGLSLAELQQVAHFIDRLQANRRAAA